MLPEGFEWRRHGSTWGQEEWLLAHGRPVGIVSVLGDICYLSHPASNESSGWTTQRAESPELAAATVERWALAHARRAR
jgi:hypothetical protein